MEKQFYQVIVDGVFEALKDKNFKIETFEKGEYFTNGEKAFMIDFDDAKSLICLKTATLEEGEGVEFKEISSWLMGEDATDRDKQSITNDFVETALEAIGAKATVTGVKKVEMPSKKKKADSIDVESFSARFLAICPAHKDEYKQNILQYGEFMYDDFFKKNGVAELEYVLNEGNARHISKYFEWLNVGFNNGDQPVRATVVYSILCTALLENSKNKKQIEAQLEKYKYLNAAVKNAMEILKSKKNQEKYL